MKKRLSSEKEFRVVYEQELRKAGAFSAYMASMERQGIPDLHVCWNGIMVWQELKFITALPAREGSGILGHRVTGQQRLFLSDVCDQGGLGVVAVGHLVPQDGLGSSGPPGAQVSFFWPSEVGKDGQLTKQQFVSCRWRARLSGRDCLRVLRLMREELDRVEHVPRGQMALWSAATR